MNDIYLKIKAIRTQKKITQEELSKRIGMAQSNYARMERGLSQITIDRLQQVAEVLEMSPEAIITYSDQQGDFKEDAQFYYNQVQKLEAKVKRLEKELSEKESEEVDHFSRNQEEKKKYSKTVSEHRKEILAKDSSLSEKNQAIEKLEREIEEKNRSIGHLQEANRRLLEMLSKNLG